MQKERKGPPKFTALFRMRLDDLEKIQAPAEVWKAVCLLAIKRIWKRDHDYAQRVCDEALLCFAKDRRLTLLLGHSLTTGRLEKLRAWTEDMQRKCLTSPRPHRDTLEGLYGDVRLMCAKLRRLPKKSWPECINNLNCPKETQEQLRDDLRSIRGAWTAALRIVAAIRQRDPESLRVQFQRKGWNLKGRKSPQTP